MPLSMFIRPFVWICAQQTVLLRTCCSSDRRVLVKPGIVEAAAERYCSGIRGRSLRWIALSFSIRTKSPNWIGSPPGYLGHRETHPVITQEELSKYHTETLNLSFPLFDEIEKASDALWQLLLGMLDKGTLTLGDNRRVDLSRTMIFLTSNLGVAERVTELMNGGDGIRATE